jgi:hypothetical protein
VSLLSTLAGSHDPRAVRLKDSLGRAYDRIDHPQLRDARRMLRATRDNAPDVAFFGESVLDFVGPHDSDQRRLPQMLDDALGPSHSLLAVHGGGYHAELLAAYLELLGQRPHRPRVVVLPLWVRGRFLPWIEHPRFGHRDALLRLAALDPATPAWQVRGSLRRATPTDFEAYYLRPHSTLLGDLTVGDYAVPLKAGTIADPHERLARLYAHHHGALLQDGGQEMEAVTRMGAAVRALGCGIVAYQTPISVPTGTAVLGQAFEDRVRANFAVMDRAFVLGAGAPVLQTGTAFGEDEFIDPADGSEHLNERGRTRLAALLADAVRPLLR